MRCDVLCRGSWWLLLAVHLACLPVLISTQNSPDGAAISLVDFLEAVGHSEAAAAVRQRIENKITVPYFSPSLPSTFSDPTEGQLSIADVFATLPGINLPHNLRSGANSKRNSTIASSSITVSEFSGGFRLNVPANSSNSLRSEHEALELPLTESESNKYDAEEQSIVMKDLENEDSLAEDEESIGSDYFSLHTSSDSLTSNDQVETTEDLELLPITSNSPILSLLEMDEKSSRITNPSSTTANATTKTFSSTNGPHNSVHPPQQSATVESGKTVNEVANFVNSSSAKNGSPTSALDHLPVISVTTVLNQKTSERMNSVLASASIVTPALVSVQQQVSSARRIQRSIDYDVLSAGNDAGTEFPSLMTLEGRSANKLKKGSRRSDPEPDIDDIIQGIMQLLGGNVKIDADSSAHTHLTTFGGGQPVSSTRTNDRGPPRMPLNPFNFFNGRPTQTRPPVRRPASESPTGIASPGRPSFMANTLPPFIATLPPQLDTPRLHLQTHESPVQTAFLMPEAMIPPSSGSEVSSSSPMFPSSISTISSTSSTILAENPTEVSYEGETTENNLKHETFPPLQPSSSEPEVLSTEATTPILQDDVNEKPTDTVYSIETDGFDLEPSIGTKESTDTVNSIYNSPLPPDLISKIRKSPSFTETSKSKKISSTISPTVAISNISQIDTTMSSSKQSIHGTTSPGLFSFTPTRSPEVQSPPPQLPVRSHVPVQRPQYPQSISHTRVVPPATVNHGPRPGMVLDAEYHPAHVVTAPVRRPTDLHGEVFDVTVSAQQGFGGQVSPVRPPHYPSYFPRPPYNYQEAGDPLLVTPTGGDDGFVSIDGRKTYFDLFPTATAKPLPHQTVGLGVGVVIPEEDMIDGEFPDDLNVGPPYSIPSNPSGITGPMGPVPPQAPQEPGLPGPYLSSPPSVPPSSIGTPLPFKRRPSTPSIRIDTCIVGDDSTCQEQLLEVCRTEGDVSSCYCKPGTDRRRPRTPCKKMALLEMSIKVNRVGQQRIAWNGNYANPASEEYQVLEWEAQKAIESAFKKSALKSVYLGSTVEKFYPLGGNVIINSSIKLEDNPNTRSRDIKRSLQRHIIKVIQAHNNNIGSSSLWVDGPLNPIPLVDDVNECSVETLNDCHEHATCLNEFASFSCRCLPGYTDRYESNPDRAGRHCETCSPDHCHKRGECKISNGKKICECKGSYYGDRCEVDGEVVAVAVGASVAAVIIILLTLLFLCMWSRRWKMQDQKSETLRRGGFLARAAAGGHYLQQKFAMVAQPQPQQFGPTMEDHIRWAQMSEAAMAAQQSLYGTLPGTTTSLYGPTNRGFLNRGHFPPARPYRNYPESVYSRVSRTLSRPLTFRDKFLAGLRSIFSRRSSTETIKTSHGDLSAFIVSPNPNTMGMQQMMALQAHLAANTQNQDHLTGNGLQHPTPLGPPTMYKPHRQMGSGTEYGPVFPPNQFGGSQYGLHPLNATLLPMGQVPPPSMVHQNFSRTPSTYGPYPGPASLTMSQSGASRATLQLCGPASSGVETSSEEEDARRGGPGSCYQIPRPKSRASVGATSKECHGIEWTRRQRAADRHS
ncbi:uncharacterized protein LOC108668242 isoform X3 [Hyalella azteca]|uniref:Uncharacterized protein LOC108668242 isoform X3 n=1 Tax=Hyalella azteca TaxID=294128 RepID=A0A8B7NBD3_HYAAZ|nr:uncharacterized protein LOC108668242 isoform X3 [Hyalella azteca]